MNLGAKKSIHSDIPKDISLKTRGKSLFFPYQPNIRSAPFFYFLFITEGSILYSAENRNWRANSQMTMPAVTLTFMECFVPNCGISRHPSLMSITS